MASRPFFAILDHLRSLKGEPHVTYPYGSTSYPVTERVMLKPVKASTIAFGTAEPDSTNFSGLKLVEQQQTGAGDRHNVEMYYRYEKLPGITITSYDVDQETQTNVRVEVTRIINTGSSAAQNVLGTKKSYIPINNYYGKQVLTTLENYASIARVEYGKQTIKQENCIVGSPTLASYAGNDGTVRASVFWDVRGGKTRIRPSRTTITYGSSSMLADSVDSYFNPGTVNLALDQMFYDVRFGSVLHDGFSLSLLTDSSNPKWGYVADATGTVAATTPTATDYLAATGWKVLHSVVVPWKYNLWRRETIEVLVG